VLSIVYLNSGMNKVAFNSEDGEAHVPGYFPEACGQAVKQR